MNRVRFFFFNSVQKSVRRRFRFRSFSNCAGELPPVGCPDTQTGLLKDQWQCHILQLIFSIKYR